MKAQIVSFHCVLKDKLGKVLSSSFNQNVINQLEDLGPSNGCTKLRGLVAGIQNVREGEHREFTVSAKDAYGTYDPDLVRNVSRSSIARNEKLVIGSEIILESGPSRHKQVYRVTQFKGDMLVLDGNHPLAGHDLTFDIDVVSARDACSEDFEDAPVSASGHYLH